VKKLVLVLALAAVLLAIGGAGSAVAAGCPSFKVLHNDRIGPASLPAGNYTIMPNAQAGLNCYAASQLLTRFLEDYDGNLPGDWAVSAQGTGKASFKKGGFLGFSVAKGGKEEGESTLGKLCPNPFMVNASAQVGPLFFGRGNYLLYLPPLSALSCNRASVLFTRFLGGPLGQLPSPWQVTAQTATFFKPAHPQRSAFRVEPLAGAG
jgi:hypothetical protein